MPKPRMKLAVSEAPRKPGNDGNYIWVHDFDESKAQTFSEAVLKASSEDRDRPLIIYIDSYGGYVDALAQMLNILDSVPNQIITVATGKAMSCGAVLLSHGDVRCVAPHTRVMVHEQSSGSRGNINDIKTDVAEFGRLNEYMNSVLAKNCGTTLKEFKTRFTNERRDIYLTPGQCLKFGIADHIGFPEIRKVITYELDFSRR